MKHQEADMALCRKKGPVRFLKSPIERKMVALSRVHSLAISDADVLLRTKEAREAVAGWYTYPKHSDTAQVSHLLCLGSVSRWHWTNLFGQGCLISVPLGFSPLTVLYRASARGTKFVLIMLSVPCSF